MKYGIKKLEYEDGEIIPSVVMGNGSVRVTDTQKDDEGFVGVAFSPAPDNTVIGKELSEEKRGEPITGMGVGFQMLFDNPLSIDVVIAALQDAKYSLVGI